MSDTASKLAGTMEYIAKERLVPGLLPDSVAEAAKLLRAMDREIESLRSVLAAKHHTVTASAEKDDGYRIIINAEAAIVDPRRYEGSLIVDAFRAQDPEFLRYASRSITKSLTAEWMRDLEFQAARAVNKALTALKTGEPHDR